MKLIDTLETELLISFSTFMSVDSVISTVLNQLDCIFYLKEQTTALKAFVDQINMFSVAQRDVTRFFALIGCWSVQLRLKNDLRRFRLIHIYDVRLADFKRSFRQVLKPYFIIYYNYFNLII